MIAAVNQVTIIIHFPKEPIVGASEAAGYQGNT
jgi:hypothetical protein